jgi:acyl-CoA thioesterase
MQNNADTLALQVADKIFKNDAYSNVLGMQLVSIGMGYSKVQMSIRHDMLNGIGIVHGGVAFSLADTAFALACNSRNILSVALDTSINFIKPVHPGDVLMAEAKEIHNGRSTGLYQVTITNQNNHTIALFKGTCYRTDKKVV